MPSSPAFQVSIQLAVESLGATEAFYAGILDAPLKRGLTAPGAPEHLMMRHDGWEIIFVEHTDVVKAHPSLEERLENFPKGVGMTFHFRVSDIEDIYDSILDEGLYILYPLVAKPYGMKEFWCFDPDGYLVVIEETTR